MKYRVGWYKVKLEKEAGKGLRRPGSEFMTIIQFRGEDVWIRVMAVKIENSGWI